MRWERLRTRNGMAVVAAAISGLGIGLWLLGVYFGSRWEQPAPPPPAPGDSLFTAAAIAQRYAEALQKGDCADAVRKTAWMQERLQRVSVETGNADAVEAERVRLRDWLRARPIEGNRLRREGVEDQYVFTPEAKIEMIGQDAGRDGLDLPVQGRVWLIARYPNPDRALRDTAGVPIQSLRVGISVSNNGLIIKAGVIGNLEIDFASVRRPQRP